MVEIVVASIFAEDVAVSVRAVVQVVLVEVVPVLVLLTVVAAGVVLDISLVSIEVVFVSDPALSVVAEGVVGSVKTTSVVSCTDVDVLEVESQSAN